MLCTCHEHSAMHFVPMTLQTTMLLFAGSLRTSLRTCPTLVGGTAGSRMRFSKRCCPQLCRPDVGEVNMCDIHRKMTDVQCLGAIDLRQTLVGVGETRLRLWDKFQQALQ